VVKHIQHKFSVPPILPWAVFYVILKS